MFITVVLAFSCAIVAGHQEALVLSSASSSSSSSSLAKVFDFSRIHYLSEHKQQRPSISKRDTLSVNKEDFNKIQAVRFVWCQLLLHRNEYVLQVPRKYFDKCCFKAEVTKSKNTYCCQPSIDLNSNDKTPKALFLCKYESSKKQWTDNIYHRIAKRDALPEGFQEDVDLDILDTIEQNAPEPGVAIEVRQNGQLINDMVTVIPGTPLVLELRLKDSASNIYGTHVNSVEVSNGVDNSETIVFRGCTIDPYLFENFVRTTNNTLQANFRAFKFPNTPFVQFRINLQVCLKKCPVAHCLTGQGRAKREVTSDYEVSLGVKLRIAGYTQANEEEILRTEHHVKLLQVKQLDLHK